MRLFRFLLLAPPGAIASSPPRRYPEFDQETAALLHRVAAVLRSAR